ncbi:hypothetical protein ACOZ4B_14830 [Haloferax prahovense]|uniref:hypothetical protein n=1 Tax=Haloferax prahovense TaxID=381852 RepID=UPI003C765865
MIQDERALRHLSGVDGLACYYNRRATRYCALEAMTLNRSVEADHPDIVVSSAPLYADEWYLAYADGRVFQRHSVWEDGHYAIWTERMSATNALENISSSTAPYPQTATAIREGSVRTEERLWPRDGGAQIVREDGAYFVVYHTEQTQLLSSSPQVEAILTWLSVIVGTVVLFGRDTSHWL